MNPNDEIRMQILQWFYDRNKNATSQYGKRGSSVKISEVKRGLRENQSLSQKQVVSNLTYLIDKGWINKNEIEKTIQVKGVTVPSTVTWYEISADGIDKIEGESDFKNSPKYAGINISAMGENIITLGDGNVVNVKYKDLREALEDLKKAAIASEMTDEQKLETTIDIGNIEDQLAKAEPDKTIIKHLWEKVQAAATIGGFIGLIGKVSTLIASLL